MMDLAAYGTALALTLATFIPPTHAGTTAIPPNVPNLSSQNVIAIVLGVLGGVVLLFSLLLCCCRCCRCCHLGLAGGMCGRGACGGVGCEGGCTCHNCFPEIPPDQPAPVLMQSAAVLPVIPAGTSYVNGGYSGYSSFSSGGAFPIGYSSYSSSGAQPSGQRHHRYHAGSNQSGNMKVYMTSPGIVGPQIY